MLTCICKVFQVTPSNVMTDVIMQWTLTSAIARAFHALSKLRLCRFITRFFSIGNRRGVFKLILKYFSGVEVFFFVCAI